MTSFFSVDFVVILGVGPISFILFLANVITCQFVLAAFLVCFLASFMSDAARRS